MIANLAILAEGERAEGKREQSGGEGDQGRATLVVEWVPSERVVRRM